MTPADARDLTNQVIGLLLTHQPDVLGKAALYTQESAEQAAKNVAAFRQTLLDELQKQSR